MPLERCAHTRPNGRRCEAFRFGGGPTCYAHTRGTFGGRRPFSGRQFSVLLNDAQIDVLARWQHERGKRSLGDALRDLLETLDAQKVD